ncbi:PaaI family thioesterase [Gordonia sp. (in: high G+C Gram-positive bacteria)]|uniref:PaaI family thioesterase n=1 Tax=Gordonia sp. (in: high G+C Gram-positive bacteria) TaxID=84139 RepID=UPI003C76DB22
MTTQPAIADPFTVFAIGRDRAAAGVLTQRLGTALTDHRGLIDLPALTVLFDDIGGIPFYRLDPTNSSMQARLTMSMVSRPAVSEELRAEAALQMHDDAYGTTAVTITGQTSGPLCFGTARNIRVGRPVTDDSAMELRPAPPAPDHVPAVAALDPTLDGAEVIAQLVDGSLPAGPITELLGGVVVGTDDDGTVRAEFTTDPWMANMMGTMHGGVIAAMLAQACSFGAQLQVRPGGGYQLIDFTCEFHRSPTVDGRRVRIDVTRVKLGRRLSLFDARIYDGDQLLGRATADARFDL